MNPDLDRLQPYPFEKIRKLVADLDTPDTPRIALSIGEPAHAAPQRVLDAYVANLRGVENYPTTRGMDALRETIAGWLARRYGLTVNERLADTQILPVNGTREALFAVAQCLLNRQAPDRDVLMPNPFYQIYEGAALLAGCEPRFYAVTPQADDDIAAIPDSAWQSAQMMYVCNPGNPSGAVLSLEALKALVVKAQQHQVILVSDECYSEIYRESVGPPPGLLQAAKAVGLDTFDGCLAFHSLSKRSNLPGLRSGFVAGDARLISQFLRYRTYHGCTLPPPVQHASIAAWSDEDHVIANRAAYDEKYARVVPLLQQAIPVDVPPAGFYLWPDLGCDDLVFTQNMHAQFNVAVVPGSYLARKADGFNPGKQRVRLALVAPVAQCVEAAERMVSCLTSDSTMQRTAP